MTEIILNSLTPMLLLFCILIIGYFCNRTKITPKNTEAVLSRLEILFFLPAMVLNTFINNCSVSSLAENWRLILFSLLIIVIAIIVAFLTAGFFSKDGYVKNIYRYSIIFGNFGFVGYPVVQALFGDEGLYRFMIFSMPIMVAVYTLGVALLIKEEGKRSIFLKLCNPPFFSIIIGIILGLCGAKNYLPSFIKDLLVQMSNCMGPAAMLLTGFTIGNYDLPSLFSDKKVYIVTLLRLIVLPLLYVVILKLLNAGSEAIIYTVFAYAIPFGLNTVVFPQAYGGDAKIGAATAVISYIVSIATLPLMYAIVQAIV